MTTKNVSVLLGKLSDSVPNIWLAVAAVAFLFGLLGYAADAVMMHFKVPDDIHAGMVGVVVGLGAGLGFWIILAGLRLRRRMLAEEIERLAELNHTVRNSLEVITWASQAQGGQYKAAVLENTARIEEKLRELFPVVGAGGQGPTYF